MAHFGELYRQIALLNIDAVYMMQGRRQNSHLTAEDYNDPKMLDKKREKFILDKQSFGDQKICVVNKTSPHSITDLVIVAQSINPLLRFNDLNSSARSHLLQLLYTFAQYVTDKDTVEANALQNGFFRIAANIDPFTEDRGSIQGERSLHVHCLCFPTNEDHSNKKTLDLSKPHNTDVVKTVDPLLLLGPQLLDEMVLSPDAPYHDEIMDKYFEHVPFEPHQLKTNGMSIASHLRLKQSWNTLKDARFETAMARVEESIEQAYIHLRSLFSNDTTLNQIAWSRPSLYSPQTIHSNIEKLPFISEDSKQGLHILADSLRSIPPDVMKWLQQKREKDKSYGYAERVLGYNGPCYTSVLYSPGLIQDTDMNTSETYLAIQPLLRRALGAGGFTHQPDGTALRINKNSTVPFLSDEERERRERFQQGFVEYQKSSVSLIAA